MVKLTRGDIKLLVDAVNCWETRYRCQFCTNSTFEEQAAAMKKKLFAVLKEGEDMERAEDDELDQSETGTVEDQLASASVEALQAMMNDAIKKENYELAGKIKGEISGRKNS